MAQHGRCGEPIVTRQLPLPVQLRDDASFASFISGKNAQAIATLCAAAEGRGEPLVYVWGPPAAGKTHLLHAACRAADRSDRHAAYIPLRASDSLEPEILEGLDEVDMLCLDDVDQVVGQESWERSLFNLFNRIRQRNRTLLVSANTRPGSLPLALPDLRSRLGWGVAFHLRPLNDDDKLQALLDAAARRGMHLEQDVASYLLRHYQRDIASLLEAIHRLDDASLAAQRRLTIPFIREVLSHTQAPATPERPPQR